MTRKRKVIAVSVGGLLVLGAIGACGGETTEQAADEPKVAVTETEASEPVVDEPEAAVTETEASEPESKPTGETAKEDSKVADYALGMGAWAGMYGETFNLVAKHSDKLASDPFNRKATRNLLSDFELLGECSDNLSMVGEPPASMRKIHRKVQTACDHFEEAAALGEQGCGVSTAICWRRRLKRFSPARS